MNLHRGLTDSGDETDTGTSNKTTNGHQSQFSGRSLHDTTDGKGQAANNDGPSTTDTVSDVTSDDCTKECTAGENSGQERLLPSWENEGVLLSLGCVWARVL